MKKTALKIGTKVSRYGNVKKAKMAAIAFNKNGSIIAYAHNKRVDGSKRQWSIHAEEALINKLDKINAFSRYKGITVLVMRVNSHGISMARPCRKCMRLLVDKGIKILYTDWKGVVRTVTLT